MTEAKSLSLSSGFYSTTFSELSESSLCLSTIKPMGRSRDKTV